MPTLVFIRGERCRDKTHGKRYTGGPLGVQRAMFVNQTRRFVEPLARALGRRVCVVLKLDLVTTHDARRVRDAARTLSWLVSARARARPGELQPRGWADPLARLGAHARVRARGACTHAYERVALV